jgi:hypothetical protein
VLSFAGEIVIDCRTPERPVNYALVRIIPPRASRSIRPAARSSWSIRGPGMGRGSAASRPNSFKAGYPRYFVGFLPEPMPGQTIEDIARAEAVFLHVVAHQHVPVPGEPAGSRRSGFSPRPNADLSAVRD